ncbi:MULTISPECIES: hypothetical protein [unclassified Streptomyces]|uniref:hypothetical protein n=1 Tax=unclassified Streptomyces TaxID=2593676 RepID=UPI00114C95B8|nr:MULTISPECIES: hypothetical protein [unclassified Streptomyces]MYS20220.1 hypothetical protein [Streptomyces sp. SID4948]
MRRDSTMITGATGIPLAVTLSGGSRDGVSRFVPQFGAVAPVRGRPGWPRCRPDVVLATAARPGMHAPLLAATA